MEEKGCWEINPAVRHGKFMKRRCARLSLPAAPRKEKG